jgi:hypothetical protein
MGWTLLTFLADAEKARVWIREAMNILKIVTVVRRTSRVATEQGRWWREGDSRKEAGNETSDLLSGRRQLVPVG